MQQQLIQMQPMMAAYYSNNVTTDHIQQFLDENKSLILKIVESQNSGKLSECAENQARLQRNLMYLAAIADSQPHPPTLPGQYLGGGVLQPQQAQQMTQQSLMAARTSLLYAPQPYSALQQHHTLHDQPGMSSDGSSGLNMFPSESGSAFPNFAREGRAGGFSGHGSERRETLDYLKAADGEN